MYLIIIIYLDDDDDDDTAGNGEESIQVIEMNDEEVSDENPIRVIRNSSDPNMFYRVTEEQIQVVPPTNCAPFLILDVLCKVIKEYIQTLCLWMCLIPERLLGFYYYFQYYENDSLIGTDLYILSNAASLLTIIFLFSFFLLTLIKK